MARPTAQRADWQLQPSGVDASVTPVLCAARSSPVRHDRPRGDRAHAGRHLAEGGFRQRVGIKTRLPISAVLSQLVTDSTSHLGVFEHLSPVEWPCPASVTDSATGVMWAKGMVLITVVPTHLRSLIDFTRSNTSGMSFHDDGDAALPCEDHVTQCTVRRKARTMVSTEFNRAIKEGAAAGIALLMTAAISSCSSSSGHRSPKISVQSSPGLSAPGASGAPSPGSGTPSPTGTSDPDRVKAAYSGYWTAAKQAGLVPIGQVRAILEPYATPALITAVTNALRDMHSKLQEPWGEVIVHVYSVKITATGATLRDCQDTSKGGMADSRTHQLIPGTRGGSAVNYTATLQRGADGRWRVAGLRNVGSPCSASGSST